MKYTHLSITSLAFLLLSGTITASFTYAKPPELTTQPTVPVSPPKQSPDSLSVPANQPQPNTQFNEQLNAQGNDQPLCFYQHPDGRIADLSKLCGVKNTGASRLANKPIDDDNDF
jgi:hypothetical protein